MRDRIECAWPRRAVGVVVCLAAGLVSAEAPAQVREGDEVTPYVERRLLLASGQAFTSFDLRGSTAPIDGSSMDLSIGAGVGLTRGLSIDGSLGTVSVAPGTRYRSPKVGLWYGLVDTEPLEIDATTHVTFGVAGQPAVVAVEPGAAAVVRLGGALRVDAAAYLPLATAENVRVGLRLPVGFAVQLGPYLHASVSSGIEVNDVLDPLAPKQVPLGFSVGATAPLGNGGFASVSPSLSWPSVTEIGGPPHAGARPMVIGANLKIVTPP